MIPEAAIGGEGGSTRPPSLRPLPEEDRRSTRAHSLQTARALSQGVSGTPRPSSGHFWDPPALLQGVSGTPGRPSLSLC